MEEVTIRNKVRPSYGGITIISGVQEAVCSTPLVRPKSRKKCSLLLLVHNLAVCTLQLLLDNRQDRS